MVLDIKDNNIFEKVSTITDLESGTTYRVENIQSVDVEHADTSVRRVPQQGGIGADDVTIGQTTVTIVIEPIQNTLYSYLRRNFNKRVNISITASDNSSSKESVSFREFTIANRPSAKRYPEGEGKHAITYIFNGARNSISETDSDGEDL